MAYFPMFIDLSGKKCVVIGGGTVAVKRVKSLIPFEPKILVISPEVSSELLELEFEKKITIQKRTYAEGDLLGAFMVIAATSDKETNSQVYREAVELGVHINSTDGVKKDAFLFPSLVKRQDIVVGISTSGDFPLLSVHLRNVITEAVGPNIGEIATHLKRIRVKLKNEDLPVKRKEIFLKHILNEIISATAENPIIQNKILLEDKVNRIYQEFLKLNKS